MTHQWRIVFEKSNGASLVHDADEGDDDIEETEGIPLTGWKIRKETDWEEDDTLTFQEFNNTDDPFLPDMDTLYIGSMISIQVRIIFKLDCIQPQEICVSHTLSHSKKKENH